MFFHWTWRRKPEKNESKDGAITVGGKSQCSKQVGFFMTSLSFAYSHLWALALALISCNFIPLMLIWPDLYCYSVSAQQLPPKRSFWYHHYPWPVPIISCCFIFYTTTEIICIYFFIICLSHWNISTKGWEPCLSGFLLYFYI